MKYRKRSVEIDAEQFFPTKYPHPDGVEQYEAHSGESVDGTREIIYAWRIKTLEGDMDVRPGDWIITGVKGEKYPCKPDIFEMTYEKVEAGEAG